MLPRLDYEALLRRRRIWGVPPDAVEELAAECERAQAELRARMTELEGQLAAAHAEQDEANRIIATLREEVVRLERENEAAANRPEAVREEAVRFVVDAWIEAQTIRDQTQREIETAHVAAQQEVAKMRRETAEERQRQEAEIAEERQRHEADMAEERQRYETEIATLHERRQRAVTALESLAENLLNHAGHTDPVSEPAPVTAMTDANGVATPQAAGEATDEPSPPTPQPVMKSIPSKANGSTEDELLVKALDELEAILSSPQK